MPIEIILYNILNFVPSPLNCDYKFNCFTSQLSNSNDKQNTNNMNSLQQTLHGGNSSLSGIDLQLTEYKERIVKMKKDLKVFLQDLNY
jgi:hypothetical protein